MAVKFQLTPKQIEGIRARFSATVDLKKEFVRARQYIESIHTGRPYKNLGLFFWRWCLRVEGWRDESPRRRGATAVTLRLLEESCTECGCKRQSPRAPLPSSATLCGWCGHDKSTRTETGDVA